jgi:hypothetical protein
LILYGTFYSRKSLSKRLIYSITKQLVMHQLGMKGAPLFNAKIIRRIHVLLALPACLAMLLTGCGGSAEPYTAQTASVDSAHTASVKKVQVSQPSSYSSIDSSSMTVNSTSNFKGFNSSMWNDNSSWYECNCSNTSQQSTPSVAPWNAG